MKQDIGYFKPKGMFRRLWKERAQLLGAQASMLLQIAHPLIAEGVTQHSHFSEDPLGRLNRTLDTMLTIVFGNKSEADGALARLSHVHTYVKGILKEDAGIFKKGMEYSAQDPELKMWVHATLMQTGLIIHERFIEKLTPEEKEQFYKESKVFASLMGIPENIIPSSLPDFNNYFQSMLESEVISVTTDARKIAEDLLSPTLPLYYGPAVRLVTAVALDILPQKILDEYSLEKGGFEEIAVKRLSQVTRVILPFSPHLLRVMPQARKSSPFSF